MKVALIPTGKLELLGLAEALGRLFPNVEFACRPFLPDPDARPFRSFTSAPLPIIGLEDEQSSLSELVGGMADTIADVDVDLVIVLDDLELLNEGNERIVVTAFRDAVVRHLDRLRARDVQQARALEQQLLLRASFHLAVPMIESWLFADPAGPAKAGAPTAQQTPRLSAGRDPEAFETQDPDYSGDQGQGCTKWCSLPRHCQSPARPEWLKTGLPRERHPKRYMSWLCRAPLERNCSTYDDKAGATALRTLDWTQVLSNPGHMTWLRALVADLADGLGCPPRCPPAHLAGAQASWTSHATVRPSPVLRNV